MEQKIFYYEGENFGISTLIKLGTFKEENKTLRIIDKKDENKKIEIKDIKNVKKVSINGVGDIIKLDLSNSTIYLAAYKGVCIANFFVRIDDDITEQIERRIIIKK